MHGPRFVFLSVTAPPPPGEPADPSGTGALAWLLVSPNNRPLGRGNELYATYAGCRQAVLQLRAAAESLVAHTEVQSRTGQWIWRAELSGETVAVSSRAYFRFRECCYSRDRFLEAVPAAEIVPGARDTRRDRRSPPPPQQRQMSKMDSLGWLT